MRAKLLGIPLLIQTNSVLWSRQRRGPEGRQRLRFLQRCRRRCRQTAVPAPVAPNASPAAAASVAAAPGPDLAFAAPPRVIVRDVGVPSGVGDSGSTDD